MVVLRNVGQRNVFDDASQVPVCDESTSFIHSPTHLFHRLPTIHLHASIHPSNSPHHHPPFHFYPTSTKSSINLFIYRHQPSNCPICPFIHHPHQAPIHPSSRYSIHSILLLPHHHSSIHSFIYVYVLCVCLCSEVWCNIHGRILTSWLSQLLPTRSPSLVYISSCLYARTFLLSRFRPQRIPSPR